MPNKSAIIIYITSKMEEEEGEEKKKCKNRFGIKGKKI